MAWSQHIQSPFPWNEGESYDFSLAVLPRTFLPYKEIWIKEVCCSENEAFHVSRWWESKIFLSMCSLTLYAPLCGSVLFPTASPYCKGCSWLLPCACSWVAVGQRGRRSRGSVTLGYLAWPPAVLQKSLCFPRSCVISVSPLWMSL